ncbi:lycopene cyclase domain-containing protein [Nocardioides sp.]|uniref:lycopene cyclase domain-containing protein n=1 Tax=Nocardioides sp. TaxID=35761 RepID=UPI00378494FC
MEQWSYVGMLAFCLVGTLPLIVVFRLRVLQQPLRLVLAILAGGLPFLVWDLWATDTGHWWFDAAQTLRWRVGGLPLEEISFFVVIPFVSILTYESVRVVRARRQGAR